MRASEVQVQVPLFTIKETMILRDIEFEISDAGIVIVAGRNGAGKSTLLNIISSRYPSKNAFIQVGGEKSNSNNVFMIPSARFLPSDFTIGEWGDFCKRKLFGFDETRYNILLNTYNLNNSKDSLKCLTLGQISALCLVTAFSSGVPLLIMDEPLTHLDPYLIEVTQKELQKEVLRGRKILLSTHYLEELGEMADRILVLKKGRLIYNGSLEQAREEMREIIVENPSEDFLRQEGVIAYRRHEEGMVRVLVREDAIGRKIPGKRYYLNLRDLFLYMEERER